MKTNYQYFERKSCLPIEGSGWTTSSFASTRVDSSKLKKLNINDLTFIKQIDFKCKVCLPEVPDWTTSSVASSTATSLIEKRIINLDQIS